MSLGGRFIRLENFCKRQWDKDYKGLVVSGKTQEEVEALVNKLYLENPDLKDGYAPFCKHLCVFPTRAAMRPCCSDPQPHVALACSFVRNFIDGARADAAPITTENAYLLRSAYQDRGSLPSFIAGPTHSALRLTAAPVFVRIHLCIRGRHASRKSCLC